MVEIVKEFVAKKIDLLKMEATEKSSVTAGIIAFVTITIVLALFFIILFNIGMGLLIGYWLGNYAYGVLIMAGFYLVLMLILFITRKSLQNMVANKIIKSLNF